MIAGAEGTYRTFLGRWWAGRGWEGRKLLGVNWEVIKDICELPSFSYRGMDDNMVFFFWGTKMEAPQRG